MSQEPPRIPLARLMTPLETVRVAGLDVKIRVKRDDLTGAALSGNKVRKLEYLLAEARRKGARRVLTCGGIQSNHCRATAVAAARCGLGALLFLRTDAPPSADERWTGNLQLSRLVGAKIRFVTREQYQRRDELMAAAAGPDDYVIPEGGSNGLGAWGYIRAMDELVEQWAESGPPSSIVVATGSGGTLAGLLIGARRHGLDLPIHGVCVCDDAAYFQQRVAEISEEATASYPSLPRIKATDVSIIEGYVGRGYALSTDEEAADIARVARSTGLVLDPVYSGKAFRVLLSEPDRLGASPLFVHTGGIFGLLA